MTPIDKLVALVRRELDAEDVRVLEADEEVPEGALVAQLPAGKQLVATFAGEIEGREPKARRLDMLVESFGETLRASNASRPPPAMSLHAELEALCERTRAVDALVIDAQSPVVWGAAEDRDPAPHLMPTDNVVSLDAHRAGTPPPPPVERPASLRAIDEVRALPAIASLHRGGHVHESVRGDDFGWAARSFAGIYVLVLVFDHPFDELGAERAIAHALPTIERLVAALPPLDPTPTAGVAAIRRRRR